MSAWLRLLCGLEEDEETVAGVAQAEHRVTETVGSRECLRGVTLKADEQQWVCWVGYPLGVPALQGQTWSNWQWSTRTVITPALSCTLKMCRCVRTACIDENPRAAVCVLQVGEILSCSDCEA